MVKLIAIIACCILGATLIDALNKEEMIKEFIKRTDECSTEVGASPADVDELMKEKKASTKEGKCMRACLMKKYGVMTDDGKFSREGAVKKAEMLTEGDPEKMKIANEIIDACMGKATSSDYCEAAEEYGCCFHGQMKERGIKME